MKTSFALAASLCTILLVGCQKSSPPPAATDQPRAAQPQASPSVPGEAAQREGALATESGADQTDDPGMTTAHDKTAKQEEPSGDESSRAAPNEGDAEPPE